MAAEITTRTKRTLGLRVKLDSGLHAVPLERIYRLAGYAALSGEPEDYFLGWLRFQGEMVPVFDLNRVICEKPTAATFGTRILLMDTAAGAPTAHVGLLAEGVTDTAVAGEEAELLDPDTFLPMLYPLTPDVPKAVR